MNTFETRSNMRDNNFDFIRVFLATLVIFAHSYDLVGRSDPFAWLTGGQTSGGGIAVAGFFLLSGFLITKSWMQTPQLSTFLQKRVLRILPGFAVALVFCVFVVGPLSGVALAGYFRSPRTYAFLAQAVGAGATGLPGVFAGNPVPGNVNGSLWTIRLEFLCYLLIAALGVMALLPRRAVIAGLLAGSLVVEAVHTYTRGGSHWPLLVSGLVSLAPFFLAGATFHSYRERIPISRRWLVVSCALIVLCCLLRSGLAFVLPFCGAYLLFYIGFYPGLRMQNFSRRGDLSYGIYLYAFPVQQLLVEYLPRGLHPLLYFALALPLTILLAALSWNFVEKPCLKLKRHLNPTNRPAASVDAQALTAASQISEVAGVNR